MKDESSTRHLVAMLHAQSDQHHEAVEQLMLSIRAGVSAGPSVGHMSDAHWTAVQRVLGHWQVGRSTLTAQVASAVGVLANPESSVSMRTRRPVAIVSALADLGHLLLEGALAGE